MEECNSLGRDIQLLLVAGLIRHFVLHADASRLNAVVSFRMLRLRSSFAQVEIEYNMVNHKGRPAETPAPWNLIGRSMTAPQSLIAQQYSSATFASLCFSYRQEKFAAR
jgi:hypothetical protein